MKHIRGLATALVSSNLQPAVSYDITIYPAGALVATSGSSTPLAVRAGHSIVSGDRILVVRGLTILGLRTVTGTPSATSIAYSGTAMTVAEGDFVINICADTSSVTNVPNYDRSKIDIYDEPSGVGTPLTNAAFNTDAASGEFNFWYKGDGLVWAAIRDSNGTLRELITGFGSVGQRLNIIDFGCKPDDSTDNQLEMNLVALNAISMGVDFYGPPGDFRMGDQLLLDGNFESDNSPNFKMIKAWESTASSPAEAMICSRTYALGTSSPSSDPNINWKGGRLTVVDTTNYGGSMIAIASDQGSVRNVVIEEWGSSSIKGFGVFCKGDDFLIDNVRAYSTNTTIGGSDGIGWSAGNGGKITNCHVETADDAYTMSTWADGISTTNGLISNCTGVTKGSVVKTFVDGAGSIDNITVTNVKGHSERLGYRLGFGDSSYTGTVSNVSLENCYFDTDTNAGVDGALTGAEGLYVINEAIDSGAVVRDINISNCHFKSGGGASTLNSGMAYILGVIGGSINNCTFDMEDYDPVHIRTLATFRCEGFSISSNRIRYNSTNTPCTSVHTIIQIGQGSVHDDKNMTVNDNIITNMMSGSANGLTTRSTGISINEGSNCVINGNVIRLAPSPVYVTGILSGSGTNEGENTIVGNNLGDWIALEAAHMAASDTAQTSDAIRVLEDGNDMVKGNLGFNFFGSKGYTASTGQLQGEVPLFTEHARVTPANDDDSVTLPYAAPGRIITVLTNHGAKGLKIWPAFGDSHQGSAANVVRHLSPNATFTTGVTFYAINYVTWQVMNGASLDFS